jgi:hypothetical protein
MKLEHRLQYLELKFVTKNPGCNVTLFIVIPKEMINGPFDSDSYRPSSGETEIFLKKLKDGGQCRDCKGSCAIDWSPEGFMNHTLAGVGSSSSPEPMIHYMFCADAEIPVLTRKLMNGGRELTSLQTSLDLMATNSYTSCTCL